MKKLTQLIFLIAILGITILSISYLKNMSEKPSWIHNLQINGEVDGQAESQIKDALWESITPYKDMEYDNVTITFLDQGGKVRVKFVGTSNYASDVYEFLYNKETKELVTVGYLLEVIPLEERSRMISIASIKPEVSDMLKTGKREEPTVRRIPPETSKDYYAPKTLISVTWSGEPAISALLDPETGMVVKTWSSATVKEK